MDPDDGTEELERAFEGDEAGMMQFLSEMIDVEDQEFLNEFRNSELFAEVMQENAGAIPGAVGGGGANSGPNRRLSLNAAERVAAMQQAATPRRRRSPSTTTSTSPEEVPRPMVSRRLPMKISDLKRSNAEKNFSGDRLPSTPSPASSSKSSGSSSGSSSSSSGSSSSGSSTGSRKSSKSSASSNEKPVNKQLQNRLKIIPGAASLPRRPSASSSSQKEKKMGVEILPRKPVEPSQARRRSEKNLSSPTFIAKKSSAGRGRFLEIKEPDSSPLVSKSKLHRPRPLSPKLKVKLQRNSLCVVHVLDIFLQKPNLFPNGIKWPLQISKQLLEELHACEMKLRRKCTQCEGDPKILSMASVSTREQTRATVGTSPASGSSVDIPNSHSESPIRKSKTPLEQMPEKEEVFIADPKIQKMERHLDKKKTEETLTSSSKSQNSVENKQDKKKEDPSSKVGTKKELGKGTARPGPKSKMTDKKNKEVSVEMGQKERSEQGAKELDKVKELCDMSPKKDTPDKSKKLTVEKEVTPAAKSKQPEKQKVFPEKTPVPSVEMITPKKSTSTVPESPVIPKKKESPLSFNKIFMLKQSLDKTTIKPMENPKSVLVGAPKPVQSDTDKPKEIDNIKCDSEVKKSVAVPEPKTDTDIDNQVLESGDKEQVPSPDLSTETSKTLSLLPPSPEKSTVAKEGEKLTETITSNEIDSLEMSIRAEHTTILVIKVEKDETSAESQVEKTVAGAADVMLEKNTSEESATTITTVEVSPIVTSAAIVEDANKAIEEFPGKEVHGVSDSARDFEVKKEGAEALVEQNKNEEKEEEPEEPMRAEEPCAIVDEPRNVEIPAPATGEIDTEIMINVDDNCEDDGGPPSPEMIDLPSGSSSPAPDDSRYSSSPEMIGRRKSPSPEKTILKKKKIIESSSDDGDLRTDDNTPERKKSSDDEPGTKKGVRFAHNPSIERKRDQDDSRSGKFGELEMERQRKKENKKGGRVKPGKYDPLEELMLEKTLMGSFRIPKRTAEPRNKKLDLRSSIVTPLTTIDVPKENLQFERFRKGLSDKDKIERKERGEWNNNRGNRGVGGVPAIASDDYSSFNKNETEDQKFGSFRGNREPSINEKFGMRDDRVVVLARADGKVVEDLVTAEDGPPEPEPAWANDGEEPGGGISPDVSAVGDECDGEATAEVADKVADDPQDRDEDKAVKEAKKEEEGTLAEVKGDGDQEKLAEEDAKKAKESEEDTSRNPEIPLESVDVNPFCVGALMYLSQNPDPQLPDVEEELNLAEVTMMKIAWWIHKGDFDNSTESGCTDDWWMVVDGLREDDSEEDEGVKSDESYLELLTFTQSEEDEIYWSLSREMQKKKSNGLVDELCGRQLLVSQYRTGPVEEKENFTHIFQLRGASTSDPYTKPNFQARCTLCDCLVVGKLNLANHVTSVQHREKMSKAGLDNIKSTAGEKQTEKGKEDKKSTDAQDKNGDSKKSGKSPDRKEKKKEDEKRKEKEDKRKDRDGKDKKRKRDSLDGSASDRADSGAEIGVTSSGLPIKIPASAIPNKDKKGEKEKERGRDKRSRSRSPRHKRNRSRSPKRSDRDRKRSRSRSPPGGRRRRSKSRERERDRGRDREVVRISRDPQNNPTNTKAKSSRRSRSTSAERVKKFLEKTRRSRSPSNGYRKRRRPSTPPMSSGVLPKRTNKEFHEKMVLTMEGKWSDELDNKWKLMELEEAIFMEQFGEMSKKLKTTPENHPNYSTEWTNFWERRYKEIEKEGKEDPDKHDYVPEWKEYWTKRLNDLLEEEYEEGINKIKVQNGVDIDTLLRIKAAPVTNVPLIAQSVVPPPTTPIPQPVPAPMLGTSSYLTPNVGIVVPTQQQQPVIMTPKPPSLDSIQGTVTPSTRSESEMTEDMTARPMSISDGVQNAPAKPAAPSPAVTTTDIMSTWEKLKSGGGLAQKPDSSSSVTRRAARAALSITSTKSSEEYSIADSNVTCESFDFGVGGGIDHILHLMRSKLEDQLSFFANKVQEYYEKAEEMELQKHNKSLYLLKDVEFVVMLFQIRDRFMAMIRAQILSKSVLDTLNICVYQLNLILEHPDCKKRKPKEPPPPVLQITDPVQEPPRPTTPPMVSVSAASSSSNVNNAFIRPTAPTSVPAPSNPSYPNKLRMRTLPEGKKNLIAQLVAGFLMSMGREDVTDRELQELLQKIRYMPPRPVVSINNSGNNTTANAARGGGGGNRDSDSTGSRSIRFGDRFESDPWRVTSDRGQVTRVAGVASIRTAGNAVPELPNVIPHFNNPTGISGGGTGPVRYGSNVGSGAVPTGNEGEGWYQDLGAGRGHGSGNNQPDNYTSAAGSSGGRRSPFSRRDFPGNPHPGTWYRGRGDKDPQSSSEDETPRNPSRRPSVEYVGGKGGMPVVKLNTESVLMPVRPKRRLHGGVVEEPEIRMDQVINRRKSAEMWAGIKQETEEENSVDRAAEAELMQYLRGENNVETSKIRRASVDNVDDTGLENLPPGVREMVLRERRNKKMREERVQPVEAEELVVSGENENYYRRRKSKKKRQKKRKEKQRRKENKSSSEDMSSDEDDSDGSKLARDRSKERRRRREKRKRRKRDRTTSSASESLPSSRAEKRGRRRGRSKSSEEIPARRSSLRKSSSEEREKKRESRGRRGSISVECVSRSRDTRRERRGESDELSPGTRRRRESRRRRHGAGSEHRNKEEGESVHRRVAPPVSDGEEPGPSEPLRVAPSRHMSDGEVRDDVSLCSVASSTRSCLKESNYTVESRPSKEVQNRYDVYVPPPMGSPNMGGYSRRPYQRTRRQPRNVTVTAPAPKLAPLVLENWESSSLSEVSNVGDENKRVGKSNDKNTPTIDKEKITEKSVPKEKVTSVSKTFWTEKDETISAVSDVSSSEKFSSAHPSPVKKVDIIKDKAIDAVQKPVPGSINKSQRVFRTSHNDRESGEVSSSSADLEEI